MTSTVFTRLTNRILANIGEDAVLRGETVTPARKVNIEHGVELTGVYGEVTVLRSVATIANEHNPAVGNTLTVGSVNYKLDALLGDNGYSSRFVLRDA